VKHRNVFLFDSDGAHQYGALALMNCANLPRSMRSAAMRPKNAFPHALGQSRPSIYLRIGSSTPDMSTAVTASRGRNGVTLNETAPRRKQRVPLTKKWMPSR
jgi:hypothetical protein